MSPLQCIATIAHRPHTNTLMRQLHKSAPFCLSDTHHINSPQIKSALRSGARLPCIRSALHLAGSQCFGSQLGCVLCGSENKQRLFVCTALSDWVFIPRTECVYCAVRTEHLTFNNSAFCPHSVFMCFVWI